MNAPLWTWILHLILCCYMLISFLWWAGEIKCGSECLKKKIRSCLISHGNLNKFFSVSEFGVCTFSHAIKIAFSHFLLQEHLESLKICIEVQNISSEKWKCGRNLHVNHRRLTHIVSNNSTAIAHRIVP